MEKMTLDIFQEEIKKQTSYALFSVDYINKCLSNLSEPNANEQLWYFVQNFLTSSANVSKLLWGSNKSQNPNRKELRESLDVPDNTNESILFSRDLRNHFEHYDERIESWVNSSERNVYVDSNIGSLNMITELDANDFLRNFDTQKMAVTFKGEIYELQPLVTELDRLNKIVSQVINNRW